MPLLRRIERHLRDSRTPPTLFGRRAVNDPRFVFDLRNGVAGQKFRPKISGAIRAS